MDWDGEEWGGVPLPATGSEGALPAGEAYF